MDLTKLKASILEDGRIDASEVAQIKDVIYADGKIDKDEADFLFDLNDGCSGAKNDVSWEEFFVKAICDYLLMDEQSPGSVDSDEAKWLIAKIDKDGTVDETEKALLIALKSKSKSMPDSLNDFIAKHS